MPSGPEVTSSNNNTSCKPLTQSHEINIQKTIFINNKINNYGKQLQEFFKETVNSMIKVL